MKLRTDDITMLLRKWSEGDALAFDQLMPVVYCELKGLAGYYLRSERPGHTLQPTALVHEACLQLMGQNAQWEDRRHFFAVASRIMRHILVDHARRRSAGKRDFERVALEEALTIPARPELDLEALNSALEALGAIDADRLRLVELRYFGGLTVEETAQVMGISPATVKRSWSFAKLWLCKYMQGVKNESGTMA